MSQTQEPLKFHLAVTKSSTIFLLATGIDRAMSILVYARPRTHWQRLEVMDMPILIEMPADANYELEFSGYMSETRQELLEIMLNSLNKDAMEFTPAKYAALKKAHKEAVDSAQESFMFEGQELLTSYAKYLLEYLKTQFNG